MCFPWVKITAGANNYGQFMSVHFADFRCILLMQPTFFLCVQSIILLENADSIQNESHSSSRGSSGSGSSSSKIMLTF